jgi:hypothetical protein
MQLAGCYVVYEVGTAGIQMIFHAPKVALIDQILYVDGDCYDTSAAKSVI